MTGERPPGRGGAFTTLHIVFITYNGLEQGILKGEGSTIDLLFDWFGLVCFANKNKNCQ
jgi:hypothetical protein